MSRIGKVPIPIPKGVEIRLDGDSLKVNGPRGELTRKIHPKVQVNTDGEKIEVSVSDSTKESKSLHGLFRVLISNMITGVSSGFERSLEIVGIGYRAELKDRNVVFNIGYSHPVNYELPEGIDARIDKMKISLTGNDKELLGKTAAKIRSFRKPEPYKGKGIKYSEEMIRRKAGKSGVK